MKKFAKLFTLAAIVAATLSTATCEAMAAPCLTEQEQCVLQDLEYRGRFAFVWWDTNGNLHISALNNGLDIRSITPGTYCGRTMDGGTITVCKDYSCNVYLNGVHVRVRSLDCKNWHAYLVPFCY